MIEKFPNIEKVVINDINSDLTNCYLTIKDDLDDLLTTHFNVPARVSF